MHYATIGSGKPPPVIALDNSPQENQDQEVIHDDVVEGTPLIRKNNKSNLAKKSKIQTRFANNYY